MTTAAAQHHQQQHSNTTNYHHNHINHTTASILECKSKYDAEFRRFGFNRSSAAANFQSRTKFDDFYTLLERLHGLADIPFNIYYTDKDGELLPINNDNNLARVLQVTVGVLRLIIFRRGECYPEQTGSGGLGTGGLGPNLVPGSTGTLHSGQYGSAAGLVGSGPGGSGPMNYSNLNSVNASVTPSYRAANLINHIKELSTTLTSSSHQSSAKPFIISYPADFRPVSAIIDVDILPDTYRRVRLHKHKSSKPLGFYIRDGRSLRVTPNGVEQVPGIFISRLMPGGLAESTGLLSVNDEVIEVNGIEVSGKTLDQVTDMMVANSSNLIITVKPTNQKYNLNRSMNQSTTSAGGGGGGGKMMSSTAMMMNTSTTSAGSAASSRAHPSRHSNRAGDVSKLSGKSNDAVVVHSGGLPNNNNNGSSMTSSSSVNSSFSSSNQPTVNRHSFKATTSTTNGNNNNNTKPQAPKPTSISSSLVVSSSDAAAGTNLTSTSTDQVKLDLKSSSSMMMRTNSQTNTNNNNNHHSDHEDVEDEEEEEDEDNDDDDDDDEEIHDATGGHHHHNHHRSASPDNSNSDDKILTL